MEKEHFIHFDNIVNATLINIYSLSKDSKKVEIILPTKDLPSLRKCIIEASNNPIKTALVVTVIG